jgi:hypothetical protein
VTRPPRSTRWRAALLAFGLAALLAAQWSGLHHRIEHGIGGHGDEVGHHCAALDAATLGVGPPAQPPQVGGAPAGVGATATVAVHAPPGGCPCPYCPRAPPRSAT